MRILSFKNLALAKLSLLSSLFSGCSMILLIYPTDQFFLTNFELERHQKTEDIIKYLSQLL